MWGDGAFGVAAGVAADGAEEFDGLGQGELFSGVARDEATPADFSGGFEATEDGDEFSPGRGDGFALEEIAK